MNLKDWVKIEENEKTCTLKHPKGHTMTVYHYALPKIQREQLKRLKLAKGGKIEGVSEQGEDVRYANKLKKRGEDPTPAMEAAKEEAKGRRLEEAHVKPKLKGLAKGGPVKYFDEGGKADSAPVNINIGGGMPAPQAPQIETPNASAPQAQPVYGSSLSNEAQKSLEGVEAGKAAAQGQANIDAAKAQASVPAIQNSLSNEQAIAEQNARAYNEVKSHTDDFANYINSTPIDPMHYQEDRSTGEKVSNMIGLALGGLSVPFGGHNFAFDMLNKQIDRDIAAQQKRHEDQRTVLGAYQQLYGDNNISTALAKSSMNDIYAKQIALSAAKLGTPQAQVNANNMIQKLMQDSENLRTNAAALIGGQRVKGMQNGAGPQANNAEWYKHHILAPNADAIAATLSKHPLAKDNLAAITEQKAKADLADKALQSIEKTFPQMVLETGDTNSPSGYIQRKAHALGSIPFVGPALEQTADVITDRQNNRDYSSDYSKIVGAVRGALQGNVSDDLLERTLKANAPEMGESLAGVKKKYNNLRSFIREHTKTDLLRTYGLSKD